MPCCFVMAPRLVMLPILEPSSALTPMPLSINSTTCRKSMSYESCDRNLTKLVNANCHCCRQDHASAGDAKHHTDTTGQHTVPVECLTGRKAMLSAWMSSAHAWQVQKQTHNIHMLKSLASLLWAVHQCRICSEGSAHMLGLIELEKDFRHKFSLCTFYAIVYQLFYCCDWLGVVPTTRHEDWQLYSSQHASVSGFRYSLCSMQSHRTLSQENKELANCRGSCSRPKQQLNRTPQYV